LLSLCPLAAKKLKHRPLLLQHRLLLPLRLLRLLRLPILLKPPSLLKPLRLPLPLRLLLLLKPPSLLKPLRLLRLLTRSNFSLLTKNGAMPRFFSPQNWGTKKGSRRSLFDNKQELLQLLI
jgi:hypothetical protein